jgi:hypothetical protein
MNDRQLRELARLAQKNACDGILYEPRLFFDAFPFEVGRQIVPGNEGAFYNGEPWPVRVTKIVAMMAPGDNVQVQPPQGDERLIQRYGLRVGHHDSFYMNEAFIALPLWHNMPTTGAQALIRGACTTLFDKTFPLGNRDTLQVEVQLLSTPPSPRKVSASFNGTGRLSHRPYQLSASIDLVDEVVQTLDVDLLRNAGVEPIDIEEMTLFCGAPEQDSNPAGDIQQLLVSIKQIGNGTEREWQSPPSAPVPFPLCPASLWGVTTGRVIVHELPGPPEAPGWLLNPNEGLTTEIISFDTTRPVSETVLLGMYGYVIVT